MNNNQQNASDPICDAAIYLLEAIGNKKPSQEKINILSNLISLVIQDYMDEAIIYKRDGVAQATQDKVDTFLCLLKEN